MSKILIVDDDMDIRESVKTILLAKNYEVITAVNGTEGLKAAKENKPDVIILDVMMDSDNEGFNVSYEIRKDKELRETPILMLTSVNEKTNFNFDPEKDGEFLPVDSFFEKPVKPLELLEKIDELIGLSKAKINISGKKAVL
jgi:two-component system, OmpR family, alkaline phosphatase synthesis response regulator PhoP